MPLIIFSSNIPFEITAIVSCTLKSKPWRRLLSTFWLVLSHNTESRPSSIVNTPGTMKSFTNKYPKICFDRLDAYVLNVVLNGENLTSFTHNLEVLIPSEE